MLEQKKPESFYVFVTHLKQRGNHIKSFESNVNFHPCVLQQSNKVSVVQQSHGMHPLTSLLPYSNEHFSPSPPHLPTDMSQKTGGNTHNTHTNKSLCTHIL